MNSFFIKLRRVLSPEDAENSSEFSVSTSIDRSGSSDSVDFAPLKKLDTLEKWERALELAKESGLYKPSESNSGVVQTILDSTPGQFIDLINNNQTYKAYVAANAKLKTCNKDWLYSFLEQGGLSVILQTLNTRTQENNFHMTHTLFELECVALLKKVLNSRTGLQFLLERTDYTNHFAHALTTKNILVKKQIFELLSALCYASQRGYDLALEALRTATNLMGRKHWTSMLVTEVKSSDIPEYSATVLALLNTILASTESRVERNNIRRKLDVIHFPTLVEKLKCSDTDEAVLVQLDSFHDQIEQDELEESESGSTGNDQDPDSPVVIFLQICNKVRNLPECDNLLNILQNLRVIEPENENFSAIWKCLEQITNQAILDVWDIASTIDIVDVAVQTEDTTIFNRGNTSAFNSEISNFSEAVSPSSIQTPHQHTLAPGFPMNPAVPRFLPTLPTHALPATQAFKLPPLTPQILSSPHAQPYSPVPPLFQQQNQSLPRAPPCPPIPPLPPSQSLPRAPSATTIPPAPPAPPAPPLPPQAPHIPSSTPSVPPAPPLPTVSPSPPTSSVTISSLATTPSPIPPAPPCPAPPQMKAALKVQPEEAVRDHVARYDSLTDSGPKPAKKMRLVAWEKIKHKEINKSKSGNLWEKLLYATVPLNLQLGDFDQLEDMFSQKQASTARNETPTKRKGPTLIRLIDSKKSLNINLIVKNLRMPIPDIVNAVEKCDTNTLNNDQVNGLLKILPDTADIKEIEAYSGETALLAEAERFYSNLLRVPEYSLRLECMKFSLEFKSRSEELASKLDNCLKAGNSILESSEMEELLHIVLVVGNFINTGCYAGNAAGFRLSLLSMIHEIKSNKPRMSMMHVLVELVEKNRPELLNFYERFENISQVAEIDNSENERELNELMKELDDIRTRITGLDQDSINKFSAVIEEATNFCATAKENLNKVNNLEACFIEFFVLDKNSYSLQECFRVFSIFCFNFKKAMSENKKRREQEERLAKRKLELAARESENLSRAKTAGGVSVSSPQEEYVIDKLLSEVRGGLKLRKTRRKSSKNVMSTALPVLADRSTVKQSYRVRTVNCLENNPNFSLRNGVTDPT